MGKDFVGVRPKGCYAGGKRVEAQSASRVGACQAGPRARRAGRGWTLVRTGPRNTAIGSGWRVTHAPLLANAHYKNQSPLKGQAGMPDLQRRIFSVPNAIPKKLARMSRGRSIVLFATFSFTQQLIRVLHDQACHQSGLPPPQDHNEPED